MTDGPLYFDHNATTPLLPEVVDAMLPFLTTHFGNPSSGHAYGRVAKAAVEQARAQVAALVGAGAGEVLFTSGGTEATALALRGAGDPTRRHVATTRVEHPATARLVDALEREGLEVTRLHVQGVVHALYAQQGAHASGAQASAAEASGAHASGAHASGAQASGAHASGAHASGAHASGAHASGAHASGAEGAHASGAHASGAHASGAHASGAEGAHASGAQASGAHASSAGQGAHASGAHASGAHASGAHASGAGQGAHASGQVVGLEDVVSARTRWLSIIHAHNETGVLQPLGALAAVTRHHGALLHVDASQSAGKVPLSLVDDGFDLLTLAAHKLYGPKGVGALIVRDGVRLAAQQLGAGHERGLRAGTENVAAIVGFGAACVAARRDLAALAVRLGTLRDRLERGLRAAVPGLLVVCAGSPRLPNTSYVLFPGVSGSAVLARAPGVAASTGSACHDGHEAPPQVLLELGFSPAVALGAVRLTLGRHTTAEAVDACITALAAAAVLAR